MRVNCLVHQQQPHTLPISPGQNHEKVGAQPWRLLRWARTDDRDAVLLCSHAGPASCRSCPTQIPLAVTPWQWMWWRWWRRLASLQPRQRSRRPISGWWRAMAPLTAAPPQPAPYRRQPSLSSPPPPPQCGFLAATLQPSATPATTPPPHLPPLGPAHVL